MNLDAGHQFPDEEGLDDIIVCSGIKAFQKGMRDDDKPAPMTTTAQVQSPAPTETEKAKDA